MKFEARITANIESNRMTNKKQTLWDTALLWHGKTYYTWCVHNTHSNWNLLKQSIGGKEGGRDRESQKALAQAFNTKWNLLELFVYVFVKYMCIYRV